MKCIIDVVYNHTSPDSILANEHPEWFWHDPDGNIGPRVPDWSDVADLDYSHRELWDYQIETLKKWAGIVDGFRCDVAPLVPLEFWLEARKSVAQVKQDTVWLCESVEPRFITFMRSRGCTALSDSELYQAFDISYDYDIFDDFEAYFKGLAPLEEYTADVNRQEYIYPDNYVKLRFLENHDRRRARSYLQDPKALRNATAFMYFQKGLTLVYAGQECGVSHLPTLFDKDDVEWNAAENVDLSPLMKRLADIKKDPLFADSSYRLSVIAYDTICAVHTKNSSDETEADESETAVGVFSFTGKPCLAELPKEGEKSVLEDGGYKNLINNEIVTVSEGRVQFAGEPIIISNRAFA